MNNLHQPRLVFLHIPKTGGTTLHSLIASHYPPDQICPERYSNLAKYTPEQLQPYYFFSGHFDADGVALIPDPRQVISMFRDPTDRILSLYYFWRSHTWENIEQHDLRGPRLAKSLPLLEFLKYSSEGIPANIDNVQMKALIGSSHVNTGGILSCSEDEALEMAKRYLSTLDCFGITEQMRASIELICTHLGISVPESIGRRMDSNAFAQTPGMEQVDRQPITEDIRAELDRLTRLDKPVYDCAKALFTDRYQHHLQTERDSLQTRYEELRRERDSLRRELERLQRPVFHRLKDPIVRLLKSATKDNRN